MRRTEKLLLLVFAIVIIVSGKHLFDYLRDSCENQKDYSQVGKIAFPDDEGDDVSEDDALQKSEGTAADVFDYQALLAENADCIGWLRIDGTDINYPVVQGEDNAYYLSHNFNREYAICGTLFMDYRNDVRWSQEHLIIYGHLMKDGSMFKQLNGYKDKSFYDDHKEITLYLKDKKYPYEVAAVYVTNTAQSGGYYDYLHKDTRKQQMEYLKQMAAYQLYETGIMVRESDELLSLSTCEYSSTNGRLIVLARRSTE